MNDIKQIPVTDIKGIGDKTAKLLNKLDIAYVGDLLEYIPRDYIKMPPISKIADLTVGSFAAVSVTVCDDYYQRKTTNNVVSTVSVRDETGVLSLVFFRLNYLRNILKFGEKLVFVGTVCKKGNKLEMEMPEIVKPSDYEIRLKSLNPVYPLTKGISSKMISKNVTIAIDEYGVPDDGLPKEIERTQGLIGIEDAYRNIHFPVDYDTLIEARQRLVYGEFYNFFRTVKNNLDSKEKEDSAFPMIETAIIDRFLTLLPFEMTNAQRKAYNDCLNDLTSGKIMNRLIQGDVGSGKTLVAFLCMLLCASNARTSVLMAPTEVLASQHFNDFIKWNEKYNLGLSICLLTGALSSKEKSLTQKEIADGNYNLIVGTHAVFQEKVSIPNLALVITDEQHRFGVKQREELAGKGNKPHVLLMSATPIPRTLASTVYADLDVSDIDELPAIRLPIKSCVIHQNKLDTALQFFVKEIRAGHQCYAICPMIEDNEDTKLNDVYTFAKLLKDKLPPQIRIDILHGRMKNNEKNKIMDSFAAHNIDILVSTTVVEVGINVPNATVIMIENAERFGLAQLHQLRGRVGRGDAQSYCIFVDGGDEKEENERLKVLISSNDGFFIAKEDMRLRGPGDLLGIRQSGIMKFKFGDVFRDSELMYKIKDLVWNE